MNMNVSLPDDLVDFVEAKMTTGRYNSSSDVVHEALRLLERIEHENADKLADLRQAWQQGLESGVPEDIDFEALKAEGRARLAASENG